MTSRLVDRFGREEMGRFLDKWWPTICSDARRPVRGVAVVTRLVRNAELLDFTDFIADFPSGSAWAEVVKGKTPNDLPIRVFYNPVKCVSIEVRFNPVPTDTDNQLVIIQSRKDHAEMFRKRMMAAFRAIGQSEYYTVNTRAIDAAIALGERK